MSHDNADTRLAIAEVMATYATGLDTKNWDMVRSCFCDEVLIDYGIISAATGAPEVPRKAEDWLAVLSGNLTGFDITQHMIANHRFDFSGSDVGCVSYLIAEHMIFDTPDALLAQSDQFITVAGYYTNRYTLADKRWRISESQLAVTWMRGNAGLFEVAAQRAAG